MITIVDYGMGNLGSISNMIKKIGFKSEITNDHEKIKQASKIILPGVGSFDAGMTNLKELGLINVLEEKILHEKIPTLGICLGMQLMTNGSEEGILKGLSWVNADTKKFIPPSKKFMVPHMGWNCVKPLKEHEVCKGIEFEDTRYYFVHSYYVDCIDRKDVLLECKYINDFTASFQKENIIGMQFHPEKSHLFGMKLIENFIAI
jgi:glutamine amidotransferase